MSRRSIPKPQVTVALAVGDAGLGQRLAEAIAAQPDLAIDERVDAADIVIVAAERLSEIGQHRPAIVCLGDGIAAEALGGALRALLPADADRAARRRRGPAGRTRAPGPAGGGSRSRTGPEPGEDEEPPAEEQVPLTPREARSPRTARRRRVEQDHRTPARRIRPYRQIPCRLPPPQARRLRPPGSGRNRTEDGTDALSVGWARPSGRAHA